ncbi:MAG TPA: HAMP domain-containing sensor histidine kinase [Chitinophaga sp.]|uniref:HAMP domain-containing sensor histidine kinase n=1 Tax=Chitinophaga sp. TaxID=1869181 RepID=UPI002C7FD43F|nr:HAMP domain-containing sensor histidine kinase [Chitinophaga sp.]HVI45168.1 HAMP domain-containing sensor histidine kinase [Chitinophaga sp.]
MPIKTISGNRMFWKIAAAFTALLIILGIVYVIIATNISRKYFNEANQQLYGSTAAHLVESTQPIRNGHPDTLVTHDIIHSIMVINPSVEVYLLDTTGRITDFVVPDKTVKRYSVNLAPVKQFISEGGKKYISGDNPKNPDRQSIFSAAPVYENNRLSGYVYAILASEKQDEAIAALSNSFVFSLGSTLFFVTLGVACLVGLITFFLITDSISRIAAVVRRFKEGDLTARITGHAGGDIGLLTSTFNEMADVIVDNIEKITATDKLRQELIANVSHDLRSPLAIMQGYIETLVIKGNDLAEVTRKKYLDIIYTSSNRLSHLIGQLFEYAKLEANQVKPIKEVFLLNELVSDVMMQYQILAKQQDIILEVKAPDNLPPVFADIALVERVIRNLLDNALKFTGHGGRITIALQQKASGVEIAISDNGIGIHPDDQPYIFERYKQLPASGEKGNGMGLGLAIVKKILELHQVSIHLKSAPGAGTTFHFLLPAAA